MASQASKASPEAVAWVRTIPTMSVVWPMCSVMAALILSNFQKPSANPRRPCTQGNAECCSQSSICGANSYRRNNCLASMGSSTNSSITRIRLNRVNTAITPQVRLNPSRSSRSTNGSAR
ncbi:hypothetical protein D3C80_1302490 [compost metagenome]